LPCPFPHLNPLPQTGEEANDSLREFTLIEAHDVVREIAEVAMEELKKQKAKSIAKPH
jgi:hypothetical protein